MGAVRIGTAGWAIPRAHADLAPGEGSHLERYARRFTCAEINSTFYRPCRESTWRRWAESVPEHFRFSVKAPKTISHEAGLQLTRECRTAVAGFLEQVRLLGERLGPILIQLPPKQVFLGTQVRAFLVYVQQMHQGPLVVEPRHASWFETEADSLLRQMRVTRVAADPSPSAAGESPGGFEGLVYFRLHGSPRTYYSAYSEEHLAALAERLANAKTVEPWVIFDNTASGAGLRNAADLDEALARR